MKTFPLIPEYDQAITSLKEVLAWVLGSPAKALIPLHWVQRIRSGKEFRLKALICSYVVREVMLNLGLYMNILPNKSWNEIG